MYGVRNNGRREAKPNMMEKTIYFDDYLSVMTTKKGLIVEALDTKHNGEDAEISEIWSGTTIEWKELKKLVGEHMMETTINRLKEELMKNRNECTQMREEIGRMEGTLMGLEEEIKKNDKVIKEETMRLVEQGEMVINMLDSIIRTKNTVEYMFSDKVYADAQHHKNSVNYYIGMVKNNYKSENLVNMIYGARMFVIEVLR